jgi:hypothetical protein
MTNSLLLSLLLLFFTNWTTVRIDYPIAPPKFYEAQYETHIIHEVGVISNLDWSGKTKEEISKSFKLGTLKRVRAERVPLEFGKIYLVN